MKAIVFSLVIFLGSCVSTFDNPIQSRGISETPTDRIVATTDVYASFKVDAFVLTLSNREGKCALLYKHDSNKVNESEKSVDLGMSAPCDFLRARWKNFEPLYYSYGKGADKRSVLLISGGQPHQTVKDKFQPNGCGTALAKIRVFHDRVEIVWLSEDGPPVCPSEGLDEVNYAT